LKKLGANLDKAIEDVVKDIEITPSLAAALGAVNSKKLKKAVKESDAAVAKIAKKAAAPKKKSAKMVKKADEKLPPPPGSDKRDKLTQQMLSGPLRKAIISNTSYADKAIFIKELAKNSSLGLTEKELNKMFSDLDERFSYRDFIEDYNKRLQARLLKLFAANGVPLGKANGRVVNPAEANRIAEAVGGQNRVPAKYNDRMIKIYYKMPGTLVMDII
jgi:hypothetical protein